MNKELYLNNVRSEITALLQNKSEISYEFERNDNMYFELYAKPVSMSHVISILVNQLQLDGVDTNKTDRIDLSRGQIFSLQINFADSVRSQVHYSEGDPCLGNMKAHFYQPKGDGVNTGLYGKEKSVCVEAISAMGTCNTLMRKTVSQPLKTIFNAGDLETAEEMIKKTFDRLFVNEIMDLASFVFHIIDRNQK